jgi:hypothetical protein
MIARVSAVCMIACFGFSVIFCTRILCHPFLDYQCLLECTCFAIFLYLHSYILYPSVTGLLSKLECMLDYVFLRFYWVYVRYCVSCIWCRVWMYMDISLDFARAARAHSWSSLWNDFHGNVFVATKCYKTCLCMSIQEFSWVFEVYVCMCTYMYVSIWL